MLKTHTLVHHTTHITLHRTTLLNHLHTPHHTTSVAPTITLPTHHTAPLRTSHNTIHTPHQYTTPHYITPIHHPFIILQTIHHTTQIHHHHHYYYRTIIPPPPPPLPLLKHMTQPLIHTTTHHSPSTSALEPRPSPHTHTHVCQDCIMLPASEDTYRGIGRDGCMYVYLERFIISCI